MKVSIVTATLNSAETLRESAESIFSQHYQQIEYIIIDGGSTDGTQDLVKTFGEKVHTLISGSDHGIYDAINKGIEQSTGEIVGLLHADDMLADPNVIGTIVNKFQESNCNATYGDLQYVHRKDKSRIIRNWRSKTFHSGMINRGWMPPHPTLYIQRDLYDKHGPYNLCYQTAADYDFMLRILRDDQLLICYLPEVLVKMRVGGVSNRKISGILRKSQEDLLIMRSQNLPFPMFALLNKNFSKISQFYRR